VFVVFSARRVNAPIDGANQTLSVRGGVARAVGNGLEADDLPILYWNTPSGGGPVMVAVKSMFDPYDPW
jgi:hypothetical protein